MGDLLPGSSYMNDPVVEQKDVVKKIIHQCRHCLTVYDDEAGETDNDIAPGTLFDELPDNYCCPLCDAPKNDFEQKEKSLPGLLPTCLA